MYSCSSSENKKIDIHIVGIDDVDGEICIDNNLDGECDGPAVGIQKEKIRLNLKDVGDDCIEDKCIFMFRQSINPKDEIIFYSGAETASFISPMTTISLISGLDCVEMSKKWNTSLEICKNYKDNRDRNSRKIAIYYISYFRQMRAFEKSLSHSVHSTVMHIVDEKNSVVSRMLEYDFEKLTGESAPDSSPIVKSMEPGMYFGAGLDTINGEIHTGANCVKYAEIVKSGERNQSLFKIDYLDSIDDLIKALRIEVSLSLSFSGVSAEALFRMIDIMDKNKNSLFLLMVLDIEKSDYKILLPEVAHIERLGPLYRDNYKNFREICGDKFINTITTGGRYIGLLEIKTSSAYEKFKLHAELHGVYKPMNFKIDIVLDYMKEKFNRDYSYTIHTFTEGALGSSLPIPIEEESGKPETNFEESDDDSEEEIPDEDEESLASLTMEKFFLNADSFKRDIFEIRDDEKGFLKHAYKVRFEPYEQIAYGYEVGTSHTGANKTLQREYEQLFRDFGEIISETEYVIAHPDEFENTKERERELRHIIRNIESYRAVIATEADYCASLGDDACPIIDFKTKYSIPSIPELQKLLPEKIYRYPSTCEEHIELHSTRYGDGEYTLFLGGDITKPFKIICRGMSLGETPQSFLNLEYRSPLPAPGSDINLSPMNNFSSATYFLDDGIHLRKEATVFQAYKVDITQEYLVILPNQNRYVKTVSYDGKEIGQHSRPASANNCGNSEYYELENEAQIRHITRGANINLRETPFIIASEMRWIANQTFEYVDTPKTFEDALKDAAEKGGFLLTTHTEQENSFFTRVLDSYGVEDVWINLKESSECEYDWLNLQSETAYRNWDVLEPNNCHGSIETAVLMKSGGKWEDVPASELHSYIIEYGKPEYSIDKSEDGKEVTVKVTNSLGGCTKVEPVENGIILKYEK